MKNIFLPLLFLLLTGCNSSRLVNTYKNEKETPTNVTKMLVVGISPNIEARKLFEYGIQNALKKKNIKVVPAIEYFGSLDLVNNLSQAEIAQLEEQLFLDQFDTVLLARVLSVETKETLKDYIENLNRFYRDFKQDYFENQFIYSFEDEEPNYKIFHTETALYQIVKEDSGKLLWRGQIDIVDPENARSSVKQYIKLLILTLGKNDIINSL